MMCGPCAGSAPLCGTSKGFPRAVQRDIGQALYAAQRGETYPAVKALKGFGGALVLEIVAPFETDAYRAV